MADVVSAERKLQAIMATNVPLHQQLDAVLALGKSLLPAVLLSQLLSTIEQLIASGAAEQALKEGAYVPDFTLPDAQGQAVTLSHLLKSGPVVIVFYRGAWCPYCNVQLHAYQQMLPQIQASGASLVAISPQTPDQSLSLAEKQALTFAVLSDVGNQVARQFGLVFTIDEAVRTAHLQVGANLPAYNGDASWELPMPGTFLIDQSGIVRLAFVDPDYIHRLDPSIVIERLANLTGEHTLAQD
jgi:peroxiredoxin